MSYYLYQTDRCKYKNIVSIVEKKSEPNGNFCSVTMLADDAIYLKGNILSWNDKYAKLKITKMQLNDILNSNDIQTEIKNKYPELFL